MSDPAPEGAAEEVDADDADAPVPVRRGRRLGRYVLCYELAAGGMATVYLARAEGIGGFDRLVALKIIHPHLAKQKEFVEMFLDEARLAARVVHPNVCSVFDYGAEDGTYFLAMDYLVGENAGRVLRVAARRADITGRPALPLILARIIADACEGLHAAHEARADDGSPLGLVHRDVTLHNLFVGYDGSVRVVDFGVAKAAGGSHRTTAGTLKGKFPYMSPEQVRQEPLDRRSDVWSLGVCLFELLARRRLFRTDGEFQTLKAVLEQEIPVPSSLRPNVPAALDAVVLKALSRDPEQRYASARELGRALNAAIGASGGAGAADLAELMDDLFADARAERFALLESARKVDPDHPSTSAVAPAPLRASLTDSLSGSIAGEGPAAAPAETRPEAKRPVAMLAGVGIAAVLALSLGAWAMFGGSAPSGASDASPPVVASPTPPSSVSPSPSPPDVVPAVVAEVTPPVVAEAPPAPPVPVERTSSHHRSDHSADSPRAPAAGGSGTINVVTPPGWADIFVDGQRAGRSPTELRLPSGHHSVRLLPYGEEPAIVRSVDVEPDSVGRLVVRLEP